jgi:hypothetical protein
VLVVVKRGVSASYIQDGSQLYKKLMGLLNEMSWEEILADSRYLDPAIMPAGIPTRTNSLSRLNTHVRIFVIDPFGGWFLTLKIDQRCDYYVTHELLPMTNISSRFAVSSCILLIRFPAASSWRICSRSAEPLSTLSR